MAGEDRKVAVVLHEEAVGGASLSIVRAVPMLEERGWNFCFWAPKPSPMADELESRGYRVEGAWRPLVYSSVALRLPPGPIKRLASTPGYLRRFRSFIRRERPALVHANSFYTVAEAIVSRRAGVPVLMHLHEMAPGGWKGQLARRLVWTKSDQVVAVSRASASDMAWRGRLPRVVYEAAPIPSEAAEVRESPEPFVVGSVGVVSRRKGSDLFIEAAKLVRERTDRVEFRLIGAPSDGPDAAWARSVLDRAAAAGVLHVPRADVFEELRRWDCFVLPSRADPFPIALLEAMASGLPVIGARVDGIAEQITPDSGQLVEAEDPAALADAVLAIAELSGAERREMGRAARERVMANFTIDVQAASLDRIYRASLERSLA